MIVDIDNPIELADTFSGASLDGPDKGHQNRSSFKISSTTVGASISELKFEYNVNTMEHQDLTMNTIASVILTTDKPIPFQPINKIPT